MPLKTEFFSAYTTAAMSADDKALPVCDAARADLLGLLESGDYTYLSITDDAHFETVKVVNDHGTLVLERGLEGTDAVAHPDGACVKSVSPTVIAAIKDLVCNYQCCDGPCECTPVAFSGANLPGGAVGQSWHGAVIFTGDAPVHCGVSQLPAWMSAQVVGGTILLDGTPTQAGEWTISCAATNCGGTQVDSYAATVQIIG